MKYIARLLSLLALSVSLSACTTYPWNSKAEKKETMCDELSSQVIFNGSTSNTRDAEIEQAGTPLAERGYEKNCAH